MEYEDKKNKDVELRSEEVQEVMGEIPPWILRSGIFTLFIIVIALLIGSWFFKYPDVIKAKIIVTSLEPPACVVARSTGKVDKVLAKNNQVIRAGTPLAVIQNTANTKDVFKLITIMDKWKKSGCSEEVSKDFFEEETLSLGSIQSAYNSFLNSLKRSTNHEKIGYLSKKIALQKLQIATQQECYETLIEQVPIVSTKKSYLEHNIESFPSSKITLKKWELQLMKSKENLLDLQQKVCELDREYRLSLQNATEELNAQIKAWEWNYLLVSPINGVVTQMGIWSSNQNVNTGDIVFSVIPSKHNTPKGKALLPVQGAGKVQKGQSTIVRLNNFPDQEFGYLLGKVENISNVPNRDGFYILEISFPHDMKTNYGQTLPITQEMIGTMDIITDDLRLMERFFMPLKNLLKNSM